MMTAHLQPAAGWIGYCIAAMRAFAAAIVVRHGQPALVGHHVHALAPSSSSRLHGVGLTQ
jgi:hypothetical protein